nr:cytochrome c oxidase subunit 3 [Proechinophthirus fluctus]
MFNNGYHPYHVLSSSPWPVLVSVSLFNLLVELMSATLLHTTPCVSVLTTLMVVALWWRDQIREFFLLGENTLWVAKTLKAGMTLFLLSEAALFGSFLWAWVGCLNTPEVWLGLAYPPMGIHSMSPGSVPLTNTLFLLSSGVTVTLSHLYLKKNSKSMALKWLFYTLFLGLAFLGLQLTEYYDSSFTMADGVYGSAFYALTGLHGLHVVVGVLFLGVNYLRLKTNQLTVGSHLSFELSIWYWHFVDVVWLIVYVMVYCTVL